MNKFCRSWIDWRCGSGRGCCCSSNDRRILFNNFINFM